MTRLSLFQTEVRAELLGIAGIDVPILDFVKLTTPHSVSVRQVAIVTCVWPMRQWRRAQDWKKEGSVK